MYNSFKEYLEVKHNRAFDVNQLSIGRLGVYDTYIQGDYLKTNFAFDKLVIMKELSPKERVKYLREKYGYNAFDGVHYYNAPKYLQPDKGTRLFKVISSNIVVPDISINAINDSSNVGSTQAVTDCQSLSRYLYDFDTTTPHTRDEIIKLENKLNKILIHDR